MTSRLLSLLGQIEYAMKLNESPAVERPPERFVSYFKGIARASFCDGSGSICLHSFTLADGQVCVKAELNWTKPKASTTCAIYPNKENFDWQRASERIAETFLAGPDAEALAAAAREGEALPAAS
ncbi:MAG TPA: hypothetical protein VIM69_12240 [Opitutaceae bacterium]